MRMRKSAGFTLVELVMVISIAAILAVFAGSRLGGSYANTAKYYQQLMAQITYARKTAIAQRLPVCVHIAVGQSSVYYAGGGGTTCPASSGVMSPSGQAPFNVTAPSGTSVTAGTGNIMFDATGRYLTSAGATPGGALTVTVSGEGTYNLTIERETGYVHP
jgi:MSHA pilin protein MshC